MRNYKRLQFKFAVVLLGFYYLLGCSTTNFFEVKSEPPQADVFVMTDKAEKKPLGKTPLSIPRDDLKTALGQDTDAGEFFTVVVEKQGFLPQTFNIPATKFGTSMVSVSAKMKEGTQEKEIGQAKEVLDHLFLAQKLAMSQQFERAQIELDKVISQFPTFSRALSMRASIYYAQKNYQESMKWYEETLKVAPDLDEAVKMLAKVRSQLGLPPTASTPAPPKDEVKK